MGAAAPLGLAGDRVGDHAIVYLDEVRIDYIHVDRASLRLDRGARSIATVRELRRSIGRAHDRAVRRNYDGGPTIEWAIRRVPVTIDDTTWTAVASFPIDLAAGARIYGSRLVLRDQHLPETLRAALAGRPLGSLIEFAAAPELAGRRIAHAWNDEQASRHGRGRWLVVDLVPETIAIGAFEGQSQG